MSAYWKSLALEKDESIQFISLQVCMCVLCAEI